MLQARTLNQQIQALRAALGTDGFRQALEQRLANVGLVLRQQDQVVMEGYRDRVESLAGANRDNQSSTADQTEAAAISQRNERAAAVSEAMASGAGESDTLRAQALSLRNWDANQSEIQRSHYDTLRSINSSLNDLNVDTKSARTNLATEANADREQLWANYFGQRSETYTQLGNVFGQQAELYGLANEAIPGFGGSKKKQKHSSNLSGDAFDAATHAMSQAWENPGIPKKLLRWDGRGDFEGRNNMSRFANAAQNVSLDRPEGATLRSWST